MGAALLLTLGATPALANDWDSTEPARDRSGVAVSIGGGTLGAGAELGYRFNDRFGLRAPFGTGSISYDEESDGETYSGDIDLGGFGLMADFYPGGGAFRISGGVFKTDYSASFEGRNIDVGGVPADIFVDVAQKEDIAPPWRLAGMRRSSAPARGSILPRVRCSGKASMSV
jgi:hypothetical protein